MIKNMKKRYVLILDAVALALMLGAGTLTGWMMAKIPACPVMSMGMLCPACGGTRCVRFLFSGQLAEAFMINPFMFVLIWYLGAALVLLNVGALLKVSWAESVALKMTGWRAVIIAAVIYAIFGVVRNFW